VAHSLEHAAELLTEVAACYARARRYRAAAAVCEERYLARALAIGSELRARARADREDPAATAANTAELRRLIADCEATIAAVHASEPYRAAAHAWSEGRFDEVARWVPQLFDGVVPEADPGPLYFPVGVTSGRGGGEHFLRASIVAERIERLVREGIPAADPPLARGADDHIHAVVLDDDPESGGSPITLMLVADLGLPRFRLEPAGEVLLYAPRLAAPTRVRCAATVSDEWWAVRPEAYGDYVGELVHELAAVGITGVCRDGAADAAP
jgi:hypothetical protein